MLYLSKSMLDLSKPMLGLVLIAATLAACGLPGLQQQPPVPAREVRDCRENMPAFGDFTVHATSASWSAERRNRDAATLTLELEFANSAQWPLALSNSGSGIRYDLEAFLTDSLGKRIAPAEIGGALSKPTVDSEIKPAETRSAKLVFHAPRGRSMLTIERHSPDRPIGRARAHLAASCIIAG